MSCQHTADWWHTRLPSALGPAFVIIGIQFEQTCITLPGKQEHGMVTIGLFRIGIFSETFSFGIIIMIDSFTIPPIMAFDAEVIIDSEASLTASGS